VVSVAKPMIGEDADRALGTLQQEFGWVPSLRQGDSVLNGLSCRLRCSIPAPAAASFRRIHRFGSSRTLSAARKWRLRRLGSESYDGLQVLRRNGFRYCCLRDSPAACADDTRCQEVRPKLRQRVVSFFHRFYMYIECSCVGNASTQSRANLRLIDQFADKIYVSTWSI